MAALHWAEWRAAMKQAIENERTYLAELENLLTLPENELGIPLLVFPPLVGTAFEHLKAVTAIAGNLAPIQNRDDWELIKKGLFKARDASRLFTAVALECSMRMNFYVKGTVE